MPEMKTDRIELLLFEFDFIIEIIVAQKRFVKFSLYAINSWMEIKACLNTRPVITLFYLPRLNCSPTHTFARFQFHSGKSTKRPTPSPVHVSP